MTGTNDSHEEISLILPWYLNGTLGGGERETVRRHLTECALCAREIEELNFIEAAIAESSAALNETLNLRPGDMEADIMDRIAEYEDSREEIRSPAPHYESETAWSRITGFFEGLGFPSLVPVGVAVLIIFQLAVIVGLASKLYTGGREEYVVLSGPGEDAGAKGPLLIISFVDTATEASIRQALDEIDGRIIDGPKPGGLYVVELTGESVSGETVDRVIGKLKAEKDIIKSVFKGVGEK